MGNIRMKDEEIMRMHQQFCNDSVINGCTRQIAHLYETAIPTYLLASDGNIQTVYDDNVNELINQIKTQKDEYIAANYGALLEVSR